MSVRVEIGEGNGCKHALVWKRLYKHLLSLLEDIHARSTSALLSTSVIWSSTIPKNPKEKEN